MGRRATAKTERQHIDIDIDIDNDSDIERLSAVRSAERAVNFHRLLFLLALYLSAVRAGSSLTTNLLLIIALVNPKVPRHAPC